MAFVDESEQMVGAQIKQNHIRKIEVGQPAEVIFKLRPGEIFEARVKQISLAGASWMLSPDEFELELPMIQPEPFWVELELTDQSVSLPPGAVGTVAIYSAGNSVTTSFRKIIQRMENGTNYLF
jgi:multidrug resistance efflux pump